MVIIYDIIIWYKIIPVLPQRDLGPFICYSAQGKGEYPDILRMLKKNSELTLILETMLHLLE